MTITLDKLPANVTEALQKQAQREGKSLQDVAAEAIARGLGVNGTHADKLDLSDIVGTWVDDPEFDEAMKDFERIESPR